MLTQLCGLNPAYGEPLQGQRYAVGQEFKPHTDYFTPGGRDFQKFCALSGNRTWTFMIYLNDVAAGGATRFKMLDKTFQPERGKLLCWNNRLPNGAVNPATLHHGMKVRKGVKYVIDQMVSRKAMERLMNDYSEIEQQLQARLADIMERSGEIEDDLRHPLDDDLEEQAIDLADDEALEGVDNVLLAEARQIRFCPRPDRQWDLRHLRQLRRGHCAPNGSRPARSRPGGIKCAAQAA